jgi:hypothetical protein
MNAGAQSARMNTPWRAPRARLSCAGDLAMNTHEPRGCRRGKQDERAIMNSVELLGPDCVLAVYSEGEPTFAAHGRGYRARDAEAEDDR